MFTKSIKDKLILFLLLLAVAICLTICNMSDLQKAKPFLYLNVIEKSVDQKIIEFQKIIKTENLKQVYRFEYLPKKYMDFIEKFNKNSYF